VVSLLKAVAAVGSVCNSVGAEHQKAQHARETSTEVLRIVRSIKVELDNAGFEGLTRDRDSSLDAIRERYRGLDTDGDNRISREEWIAYFGNDDGFDDCDRDRSGFIDLEEWEHNRSEQLAARDHEVDEWRQRVAGLSLQADLLKRDCQAQHKRLMHEVSLSPIHESEDYKAVHRVVGEQHKHAEVKLQQLEVEDSCISASPPMMPDSGPLDDCAIQSSNLDKDLGSPEALRKIYTEPEMRTQLVQQYGGWSPSVEAEVQASLAAQES